MHTPIIFTHIIKAENEPKEIEIRTCRLWSLMWAQICLTASAREDSGAPRKLPRAGEIGVGFRMPAVLLTFLLGLTTSPDALGLGFAFDFGAAALILTAAPAVEVEDLAGARRALQPLKTLIAVDDDIALFFFSHNDQWLSHSLYSLSVSVP